MDDIGMLGDGAGYKDGVIRTMLPALGVNRAGAILEAVIEGAANGGLAPYPVVHFHITLARDIEQARFSDVLFSLNELNTAISGAGFPSFGNFALYMPYGQIYLSYRMPINAEALDAELENVRFFLGTLYNQLDVFSDMVLFIAQGNRKMTIERFMEYVADIKHLDDISERAEKLTKVLEKLESRIPDER